MKYVSELFSSSKVTNTHCNCGTIPGSAECGVIGVIGPGVAGPMLGGGTDPLEPPKFTIGEDIVCCYNKSAFL